MPKQTKATLVEELRTLLLSPGQAGEPQTRGLLIRAQEILPAMKGNIDKDTLAISRVRSIIDSL